MRPRLLMALPALLGLWWAALAQAGCDTAQALLGQALAVPAPESRAALLRASIAACPSGLAWLELGRVHLAQGALSQAETALGQSLKWTGVAKERAAALAELGRVYQGMGRQAEALAAWRESLGLVPDPRLEGLARELEASRTPR